MAREVFISYAHKDVALVRELIGGLSRSGVKIWWDKNLQSGDAWGRILLDRLSNADGLVVCWSAAAINSANVRAEAKLALDRALLLPVFLEVCMPPAPFEAIQAVDLRHWRGDCDDPAFKTLLAGIERNFAERNALERFRAAEKKLANLLSDMDFSKIMQDAVAGKPIAQSLLGHAYVIGTSRLAKNLPEGVSWLQKAAENGVADAAATLGTVYALLLEPNDWARAVRWYDHAARLGDAGAAAELARIYNTGFDCVEKNAVLAASYSELSATLAPARRRGPVSDRLKRLFCWRKGR